MSEIDLKPCPFCGGKAGMIASLSGREDRVWFVAKCTNHNCIGNYINIWDITPDKAAEAWNRRDQ